MKQQIKDILAERARQEILWGNQTHTLTQWLSILVEEIGEVANEINEMNSTKEPKKKLEHLKNYRTELVQVAAVALQMIEKVDEAVHPLDLRLKTRKEA